MSLFYNKETDEPKIGNVIITIVVIGFIFIVAFMTIMPTYRIYKQDLQGKANLRQQEWEKKILIEDANAKNEAATLQALALIKQETAKSEAEVIRAKGVAQANSIIADSLKGNESYLRYLWIDKLSDNQNVIYVPTEAGLPILEARNK